MKMKNLVFAVVLTFVLGLALNTNAVAKENKDKAATKAPTEAAAASAPAGSAVIGYVDLDRAVNEVNEGKAAKAKLDADGKSKQQKLEIMQNDLKKMKEDLDKQRLILSADAMREKEAQFQQKFMELQKTGMDFEKQFNDAYAKAIKPISDKLQVVIAQIAQSKGYALVVPKAMALYALPSSDMTQAVIDNYNKGK